MCAFILTAVVLGVLGYVFKDEVKLVYAKVKEKVQK